MKLAMLTPLYLLLLAQASVAADPPLPATGEVIDVQRHCEVRTSATSSALRLKVGDHLKAGDRVSCERSGSLTYLSLQGAVPVRVAIVRPDFHMVPNTPLNPPESPLNRGGRSASAGQPEPQDFFAGIPGDAQAGNSLDKLLSGFGWISQDIASKAPEDCQATPTTLVIGDPAPGDSQAARTVDWMRQVARNQRCVEIISKQALAIDAALSGLKRDQAVELTIAPPCTTDANCSSADAVQLILKRYGQDHPIASTVRTLNSEPSPLALDKQDQQGLSDDLKFLLYQTQPAKDHGAR